MSNELKSKIYAAVKAAAASGHLTEMEIASAVGEIVTKGEGEKQREVVSIPLTNAIEVMTSKKWLKHLVIRATKTTPVRNVLIPGPVPMPPLPKDDEPEPGPPLKVWVDPEATIPGRMGRIEPATPIAIPAAKQKAVAAVAAPPEAVVVMKVEPAPSAPPARIVGTPEERAIAAWEQMIDAGDRFAQRNWIYRANLGSRSTMGPRWECVYAAVKGAIEKINQGQPMGQFRGVVAEAVAEMPPKFTVTRKKPDRVLPSVLEQLKAEAEALEDAIAPANAELHRAQSALDELLSRKSRVMAAIAALEGDNVSV